jgi:hypothetical protein
LQKCAAIYLPCNFEVNPITHFELWTFAYLTDYAN